MKALYSGKRHRPFQRNNQPGKSRSLYFLAVSSLKISHEADSDNAQKCSIIPVSSKYQLVSDILVIGTLLEDMLPISVLYK